MKDFQKLSDYPYKYSNITERIIGCFYTVYNALGYGFLEKVYENSITIELSKVGFQVHQQKSISVWYGDEIVGEYLFYFSFFYETLTDILSSLFSSLSSAILFS